MSFDRQALVQAIAVHGRAARVVVAESRGSVPREAGAAMLVWADGQSGTIGGGALEWQAAAEARRALEAGADRLQRVPLGPGVGQCCGGAVTLLIEAWDSERLSRSGDKIIARPVPGHAAEPSLRIRRYLRAARGAGEVPRSALIDGWMIEPVTAPARDIWIWGAGHVGRALVSILAPLPDIAVTWIDSAEARFPQAVPESVARRIEAEPPAAVADAPAAAEHYVLTYSHALDLALCHALLLHGFGRCGLIGSATKWARFRSRLSALGHAPAEFARIRCPIGDPTLGKHPQAIAIGVAAEVLTPAATAVGVQPR